MWDSEAHKPAKQLPPRILRMVTFSWSITKDIRERQHPLFYFFDLPRVTHGSLGHRLSTQQLDSHRNGTHIVVLD